MTFDLSTPNHATSGYIPRSFPIPSLNILESFVFDYAVDKQTSRQTDRQTDGRTDGRTDSKILPTPTDRAGVGNN